MPETIKSFTPVTWKLGSEQVELLVENAELLGEDEKLALAEIEQNPLTAEQCEEVERRAQIPIGELLSYGVFFTDEWPEGPPHPSSTLPLLQDAFAKLCINLVFDPHPTGRDLLEEGRGWLARAHAEKAKQATDETSSGEGAEDSDEK